MTYAKGKTIKADVNYNQPNEHEFTLDSKLNAPHAEIKNIQLQMQGKEIGQKSSSHVEVTYDAKTFRLDSEVDLSEKTPSVSLKLKQPDGKPAEIYGKVKKYNEKEFVGDVKVNLPEFSLVGAIDSYIESVDDFKIKANVDSPNLNLDKVVVEAVNKGGKGEKKIEFTAKSNDKNLISGSTNYKTRQEAGKFTMEGSGSFKVKDESKTANFKFSRSDLTKEKNGEEGVDVSVIFFEFYFLLLMTHLSSLNFIFSCLWQIRCQSLLSLTKHFVFKKAFCLRQGVLF